MSTSYRAKGTVTSSYATGLTDPRGFTGRPSCITFPAAIRYLLSPLKYKPGNEKLETPRWITSAWEWLLRDEFGLPHKSNELADTPGDDAYDDDHAKCHEKGQASMADSLQLLSSSDNLRNLRLSRRIQLREFQIHHAISI